MYKLVQLILIFFTAVLIMAADSLIKKASFDNNFWTAFKNPLMFLVFLLYCIQIVLLVFIFHKGNLAIYANLFVVFYSILMVLSGVLFFKEALSVSQYIGIVLALIAAILINK